LHRFGEAADRILEIAELYYLLHEDGFPTPQVLARIGMVHAIESDGCRSAPWNPLLAHLRKHVRTHWPEFTTEQFTKCIAIAELWAELWADRITRSSWPHQNMLCASGRAVSVSLKSADEADDGADDDAMSVDPARSLDAMASRTQGAEGRDWRRLRARLVPGDRLVNYSTGEDSFALMMGSSGIALVRNDKAIDYVELLRN
jgi:hypothetical protein